MNDFLILLFQFLVFIFSVMVHEISHGLIAYRLGDDTAKQMDRLNLNPLKHLDFFGSFLLPFILVITGSPVIFGWAKPVPYDPNKLKNPKFGAALIGAAGPASNLTIALIFAILIRLMGPLANLNENIAPALLFFNIIIFINILLAVFNLVPIPPLDGSKLLFALLPGKFYRFQRTLEDYGLVILLFFLFFGFGLIIPIISMFYRLLVGEYGTF